jgi:CheY-like chemotaxis protein/HPt (histidine-containing phosphotransfer) domain-containing protein
LGTKLHILLAEDSLINQKLASALLEEEGHTVTAVSNGCEACELLEGGEFDLVLMDVQMPEMDGLEATRIIRARERSQKTRIPIIAMTARALAGDREKCLETGMDDYIVKPIRPDELFRAIGKALAAPRPKAAAAAPTAFPPGAIDWTVAMRAVRGNLRLLRTIVEIAVKEIPALIATLREAVAADKAPELQLAAHTLKGVIRYFASSEGFAHVRQLEKMGQCKNLEQAQQTLGCLEAETEPLVVALGEYLQKEQVET